MSKRRADEPAPEAAPDKKARTSETKKDENGYGVEFDPHADTLYVVAFSGTCGFDSFEFFYTEGTLNNPAVHVRLFRGSNKALTAGIEGMIRALPGKDAEWAGVGPDSNWKKKMNNKAKWAALNSLNSSGSHKTPKMRCIVEPCREV